MDIALYLWTTFYNTPKEEFNFKGYIPVVAERTQATKAVYIEVKQTPPVNPQQVVSQPVITQPLTEQEYKQVRPEPTGCPKGDSIPMNACYK